MDKLTESADDMGDVLHPEEIRAKLRIKFGTLGAFEAARGLPARSVTDVLRGRAIRRTEKAIAAELGVELHAISPRYSDFASTNVDNSGDRASPQHQNAGVR